MAIDIRRTYQERVDSTPILVGSSVTEEGQGLVATLVGGVEYVAPSQGASGEVFAGFASFRQLSYSTAPFVEDVTVPGAAPFTVNLQHNNLVAGQIRVHDVANNTDYTVANSAVVVSPAAPAAGQVAVDYANGVLTFNSAQAGLQMQVYYRYNMTVYQAQAFYYQAATNYPDPNYFGQVGVMKGKGRLYTAWYDTAINWQAWTPATPLRLGLVNGMAGVITTSGNGALIPGGRVVYAPEVGVTPTADHQCLGIEWIA